MGPYYISIRERYNTSVMLIPIISKMSKMVSHVLCQCPLACWKAFFGKPLHPLSKLLEIIVCLPLVSVLTMALVSGSSVRNEVTRPECKGGSQRWPWKSSPSSAVVLTWISRAECPDALLHPPPEPAFGVTCPIAIPRALTCKECFCGVLQTPTPLSSQEH